LGSRILLIFPPSLYRNYTPPLNLAYLGAVLEQQGNTVGVIDASALYWRGSTSEIRKSAEAFAPDMIGITLNALFIQPGYETVRELRSMGVPIVAGGPHPSLLAHEALDHGVDIVVRGEGEETIGELVDFVNGKQTLDQINGISFRRQGFYRDNPDRPLITDLDRLPFPAKHLSDRRLYVEDSETYQAMGPIFSGRGCPARCSYCYKGVFGQTIRIRSAENVFLEMLDTYQRYGTTAFEFMDDAFSVDNRRVAELCQLILARMPVPIRWQCTTRLDLTDRNLLELMHNAGCFRVFYGFESGDRETLRRVRKKLDLDNAIQVLRWTHETGIKSIVGFMYGFPWETEEQVNNTTKIIKRISRFVNEINPLGIMVPVPGTAIYKEYADQYGFKDWWLRDEYGAKYRSNRYYPFFRRRFYNDFALLEDGFFPFPPRVRRAIIRGTRTIGWHNLRRNNNLVKALILLGVVYLSMGIYRIHPSVEQWLFSRLGQLKAIITSRSSRY